MPPSVAELSSHIMGRDILPEHVRLRHQALVGLPCKKIRSHRNESEYSQDPDQQACHLHDPDTLLLRQLAPPPEDGKTPGRLFLLFRFP